MNSIIISKEDILKLMDKSFEEGYGGYLELKEDSTNSILENYLNSRSTISKTPIEKQNSLFGYGQYDISIGNSFAQSSVNNTNITSSNSPNINDINSPSSGQITLSFNY